MPHYCSGYWCPGWHMHQGKWPSKFSKPQDVGDQSRTGCYSCKKRDPLLKLVTWHLTLHFLCMESHKDIRETLSLASSLILYKQGSALVQFRKPDQERCGFIHLWLAISTLPGLWLIHQLLSLFLLCTLPGNIYILPLSFFLLSSKQKLALVGGIKKKSLLRIWAKSGIQFRAMI